MNHSPEVYCGCGERAANALCAHDNELYYLENDWFRKARAAESCLTDRIEADRAYHEGYNEARLAFRVAYFTSRSKEHEQRR